MKVYEYIKQNIAASYTMIFVHIHSRQSFVIPFRLIACDPACDDGLMRCTGTGSNDCCAAFEDGDCIPTTTCSETNFVANEQSNFTCGKHYSKTR